MPFLAPTLLIGAAAVSVPIGLHFFYKARHRPLPWAAMKFLKLSIEQTSRRLKFQEWILLALRVLALLLLALALARPSCVSSSAGGRSDGVDAIMVFDTSYSMGAKDGEMTRLERAKSAALAVINNLPPNSTVQVYTNAGTAQAVQAKFTPTNLDQARNVVQGITLTSLSGDMLPGLHAAYEALDRVEGTNKEVYLFTDMQKSGWDRQAGSIRSKTKEIKERATLIIVRCGNADRAVNNVAIMDITYPESIPVADTRMPVTVIVKNTGVNPVRNIPVTLEVDGIRQEVDTAITGEIGPGGSSPVTITAKLGKAGPRLLTAKLGGMVPDAPGQQANNVTQPDDLPGDNRFDKLILVREKIRVLLVDGNPNPRDTQDSGSHYLRNALQPVPESARASYFIKITEVAADEAAAAQLGETDLCILVNVPASNSDLPGIPGLSKEFLSRLPNYVKDGGGLIIAAGDRVRAASYNTYLGTGGSNLLPFDLTEPITAKDDAPFKPAPDSALIGSFLAKLREYPYAPMTADVEVTKIVGLDETKGGGTALVRLDNQAPLISSKPIGEGEVLFFNTTLDTKWNNWGAKGGSYVSLARWSVAHLTSKSTRFGNRIAGEPLIYTPTEASRPFELEKPDKTHVLLGKARGGENGEKLSISTNDTNIAGEYRMGYEGEMLAGPRFAVIPDLRESENLASLTDKEVVEQVGFAPVMITAGSEVDTQVGVERSRRELTIWVLILLFAVAGVEAFWAWYCGKAW